MLFIALTGRAHPFGVYLGRKPRSQQLVITKLEVTQPGNDDGALADARWLIGQSAPDCIPLVSAVWSPQNPSARPICGREICAAFAQTSAETAAAYRWGNTPKGICHRKLAAP